MRRASAGPFKLGDLARLAGATLDGEAGVEIRQVASIESGGEGCLVFVDHARFLPALAASRASAVVLRPRDAGATPLPKLLSENPHACFARVAALLNPHARPVPGIHPAATVAPTARVAASASVGPGAVIGDGTTIGARATIGPNAVIGSAVHVGEDCVVHAGAIVQSNCRLGARVIVHSGAVIGADGFGFAYAAGTWLKVPQLGAVRVGDDVEIGAGTTIDRGALDDTVIEDGVKLDNQIQVGHNCRIGAHTAVAGCAGIAGSTVIGRGCRIGGAAMISGHLVIADRVTVSGGTFVGKSIREAGSVYTSVVPALEHGAWKRSAVHLRHLGELAQRVRRLEQRLDDAREKGE